MTTTPEGLPRGFRGQAEIERPLLELGPFAPWHATVRVEPVRLARGRLSSVPRDVIFRVAAEWVGPPPVHFAPDDRPGHRQDVYHVDGDLELARAIAHEAAAALRAARVPDLREIADDYRDRLRGGYS